MACIALLVACIGLVPRIRGAAEIMQPEVRCTDQHGDKNQQIQINIMVKELDATSWCAESSSAQAGIPLDKARPTANQITNPSAASNTQTVDKMATMSDQTPVSLLGALATGANELEPVGLFPWPFKSPDVEYVFQAQFVSAASCLCLCSPVFLSSAYLSPPLCSDNLPLRLGLCVRTQCHKSKYFNTRYL